MQNGAIPRFWLSSAAAQDSCSLLAQHWRMPAKAVIEKAELRLNEALPLHCVVPLNEPAGTLLKEIGLIDPGTQVFTARSR